MKRNYIIKEIWKDVPNYEGLYQVSNLGNVRSLDRYVFRSDGIKHFCKGRKLIPSKNKDGYLQIKLCKNSKDKTTKNT
ncbi:NUMOD4 domain-containing protein [uncultured Thomasclavelia sp.]|uniref:NUMOD4 domain-containing protein n=1 Tax=uncultured Thomasclavelia sp. TaxID=3025759 RepID=UPI003458111D